ncbi:olfactory receptor 2A2-like [Patagioenas fasciata]|uniref:olfactory receptor 2A2-like n=1 Tax=Patagioenas fasciata TaxID=372321 RepID=UPI0032E9289B
MQNETSVTEFIRLGFSSNPALLLCLFGLFSVLYSAALMGNILVLVLICLGYRLHSPMYFFFCHLSIVDICCVSNNVPHMLRNLLGQGRTISFAGCGTQIHLYSIFALIEHILLAVMSYDLYVAICHPLCYALIMNRRVCLTLTAVSWALGFIFGILQASLALHLPFCGPCEADHFCEILAVLRLACTDTTDNKILIFAVCVCFLLFPLALILISCLHILSTILPIHSAAGWHKTFSTCGSHLTAVSLFYGNVIFMYMWPWNSNSSGQEKVLSLFYSLISPSLNPLIYSLRNKQVKEALLKLQMRKRVFHSM